MPRTTFGPRAVDQIREMWRRDRDLPYGGSGPGIEPKLWNPGTVPAIVTTPITACSGTAPGSGGASLYRSIEGTMVETDTLVPISNWSTTSGTIANGTHIMVAWSNGVWFLVSRDCP